MHGKLQYTFKMHLRYVFCSQEKPWLNLKLCCVVLLFIGLPYRLIAQDDSLRIDGQVLHMHTQEQLAGATIKILHSELPVVSYADEQGYFSISLAKPGRYTLEVSCVGYHTVVLPNILLTAGKTPYVTVSLEEQITSLSAVQINANRKRSDAINSMTLVSVKSFSIDEASRYAGSFDDPARMALAYAGVQGGGDDIRNDIVIRGNSPKGLQWRLEGIEIPNPNHFSDGLPSGGAVSMLSSNVLSNSDFLTGAFSADYGNALSGVFDLHLRKGNNREREHAFQAGLLGLEAATEGPFSKNYQGSYMVNYRYSLLGLIGGLVESQNSKYQDLTYNIYLPTKHAGNFRLFGLWGQSSERENEQHAFPPVGNYIPSATEHSVGIFGLRNDLRLSKSSRLKCIVMHANNVSNSSTNGLIIIDPPSQTPRTGLVKSSFEAANRTTRATIELSSKLSKRVFLKSGVVHSWLQYDLKESTSNELTNQSDTGINQQGHTVLSQGFINLKHRISNRLKWIGGVHTTLFGLNHSLTLEPRFAIQWRANSRVSLSAGYGMHSRMEGLGLYKAEVGRDSTPNEDLGLTRAQHFVIGSKIKVWEKTHVSIEAYIQNLFDVPRGEGTLSSLNFNGNEVIDVALSGDGTGRNKGLDISLEHPLNEGLYALATLSLFSSRFTNLNQSYATNFDGLYASTVLLGKEFSFDDNQRVLTLGSKFIWNGGTPITPLLLEESLATKSVVEDATRFHEDRMNDYIRLDFQLSFRVNKKKLSHLIKLDIQNILNRDNQLERYYDTGTEHIQWRVQSGVIPVFSYKILF